MLIKCWNTFGDEGLSNLTKYLRTDYCLLVLIQPCLYCFCSNLKLFGYVANGCIFCFIDCYNLLSEIQ